MKLRLVLLTTFTALFSLAGIAETPSQTTQTQTPATQTATPTQSTTTQSVTNQTTPTAQTTDKTAKKDANLLGILLVINTNEVNAGKLAESKTSNDDVKQFAQKMETDHSKNADDTKALASKLGIEPATTDKSQTLEKKGQAELEKLKSTPDKKFDVVYITAMVKGHKTVLNLLNNAIQKTDNTDVKQHLEATREAVKEHLKLAENIQTKLK